MPAYWVVNLHTSYQVTKNIQIFGLINNLFNQHYYSAGTVFDPGGFNNYFGWRQSIQLERSAQHAAGHAARGLCRHQGDVLRSCFSGHAFK